MILRDYFKIDDMRNIEEEQKSNLSFYSDEYYKNIGNSLVEGEYKGDLSGNVDDAVIVAELKSAVRKIFTKLEIIPSVDRHQQELNVLKLFKYLVHTSQYDEKIMAEKSSDASLNIYQLELRDIYRCLCQHRSVGTSDSASLALLLRECGIRSNHLTIGNEEAKRFYEVAVFRLDGKDYIGDVTKVRNILPYTKGGEVSLQMAIMPIEDYFNCVNSGDKILCVHEPLKFNGNASQSKNRNNENDLSL